MSQTSLFNLMPECHIWKVGELTERIRDLLAGAFRDISVEGEVSNFKAATSGHLYFTLKDWDAQIRSARVFLLRGARPGVLPRRRLARDCARLHRRLRTPRRISNLRNQHRACRPWRAAARFRATEKAPRSRRTVRCRPEKAATTAAALHRRSHVADGRCHSRHCACSQAPVSKRASHAVSRKGAGRGRREGNRASGESF